MPSHVPAIEKPLLAGPSVRLRPLGPADAPAIHAALAEPTLLRLTGTHAHHDLAAVEAHCAAIAVANDRWDYGIIAGDRLIGEVVLNHLDRPNRLASLRIAIWNPDDRGRGHGTEAVRLLVAFGFDRLGLNRIELEVFAFNPGARRAYEKVGFRLEGTRREALIWGDEIVDAHVMGLLRREFDAAGQGGGQTPQRPGVDSSDSFPGPVPSSG